MIRHVIPRLDRLARSTRDLLNLLDEVARAGANFKSLADAWADTTTTQGRLIVTVLGGLAEFERELIQARTTEGRVPAVAAGVRMGRRPSLSPTQRAHAVEMREAGKSLQEIGNVLGVSHMTVRRIEDHGSRELNGTSAVSSADTGLTPSSLFQLGNGAQ